MLETESENPVSTTNRVSANESLDRWLALVVGLAAFALYLRTLAPGLLWGDSAEFQFAAWLGGFAHPTGYPLYLMLGWLWTHLLPLGDPAWRLNLFSAAWGGVAVALVYLVALRTVRRVGRHSAASASVQPFHHVATALIDRLPAFAAALVFAATPTLWSQAVIAEVYTLHAAFTAALLLATLAWADRPIRTIPWTGLYLLAGLVGLSLAHHRTTLLLLPGLVVFLWLARDPGPVVAQKGFLPRRLFLAGALVAAPLLFYAYIPLVAPHAPYFTVALASGQQLPLYEPTVAGFLAHISGSIFGAALDAPRGPWLFTLLQRLADEMTWAGVLVGIVGVGWLALRDRRILVLTGLGFIGIVGFNAVYTIGDIYVFYIPAYLIWAVWLAAGVGALSQGLAAGAQQVLGTGRAFLSGTVVVVPALLLVLFGWLLAANFARLDRSSDNTARAVWTSILAQPIPKDAILITNDRDEMVPQWYLRYVEGQRPDLTGLFPLIQPGPAWSDVAAVIEQALRSGRPVYLGKPMPGLEVKFVLEPVSATAKDGIGGLVRVQGYAARDALLHARNVIFGERLRLTGYDVRVPTVNAGETLEVVLEWEPLASIEHDYTTFVHLVNTEGTVVGQSDHRPGGVYYPTSLWRPGNRLRDVHRVVISSAPGPGPYALEVGIYRLTPALQHLGVPQRVGEVGTGG